MSLAAGLRSSDRCPEAGPLDGRLRGKTNSYCTPPPEFQLDAVKFQLDAVRRPAR